MDTNGTNGVMSAPPAFGSHVMQESGSGYQDKDLNEDKPLNNGWLEGQPLPEDWRDRVLNEALHAGRYYDESLDALLLAIRRCQPDHATITLWPERRQLMRFLEQETQNLRSLLHSSAGLV